VTFNGIFHRLHDTTIGYHQSVHPHISISHLGVERGVIGDDGKPVYGPNGKVKQKIRIANGRFADGTVQSFYFLEGHEHAGTFKGMAEILK
jgi:hypothetical protein